MEYPKYFKYPGDGYNAVTVIKQISDHEFLGYGTLVIDAYFMGGFYEVQPDWEPITKEEAQKLVKRHVVL